MNKRKRALIKIVLYPIAAAMTFYLVICLMAFLGQERLVYHPSCAMGLKPSDLGLDFQDLRLKIQDDAFIHAWFVPHDPKTEYVATILLCHGNAGNISHRVEILKAFSESGFDTLIFDYRGYGASSEGTSEASTYADAERAWTFLVEEKKIDPKEIIIIGRSLGGPIAARTARVHAPRALVLDSTFTSLADVGSRHFPFLPVRLLGRIKYETLKDASAADCPVLVMHDPVDHIVPFDLGENLYNALPDPKGFVELRGGHNDSYMVMGEAYTDAIKDFLEAHKIAAPPSAASRNHRH